MADAAARERLTHRTYLAEAGRRGRRAPRPPPPAPHRRGPLPPPLRLTDFDLAAAPTVAPATLAALATGAWIDAGEQSRQEPRAAAYLARRRAEGKTRRKAMRPLKRHLSDVVYQQLRRDVSAALDT
jgi:hypothetical protein